MRVATAKYQFTPGVLRLPFWRRIGINHQNAKDRPRSSHTGSPMHMCWIDVAIIATEHKHAITKFRDELHHHR